MILPRSSSTETRTVWFPLQQSELIVEKLKKAGVETKLIVKKGVADHGWLTIGEDAAHAFIDWSRPAPQARRTRHAES